MYSLTVKTALALSLSGLWLVSMNAWSQEAGESPFDQQPETRMACERLQAQIDQTIRGNGARHFLLEVVDNAQIEGDMVREGEAYAGAEVVGSCDGGTRKVVYSRQGATEMSSPGSASSPEASEAQEGAVSDGDRENGATSYDTPGDRDDNAATTSGTRENSGRVTDTLEPESSP